MDYTLTLTMDGRALSTGDAVTTPMGAGSVIDFQSPDEYDFQVFVKLNTPRDMGSKFWFTFQEVKRAHEDDDELTRLRAQVAALEASSAFQIGSAIIRGN